MSMVFHGKPHSIKRAEDAELHHDLLAENNVAPEAMQRARGMSSEERAAIDTHLATKGVRQFNSCDSGDDFHICAMLRARGHKIFRTVAEGHRSIKYNLDGKVITRAAFIAFVDELRAAMGKPPMGVAA